MNVLGGLRRSRDEESVELRRDPLELRAIELLMALRTLGLSSANQDGLYILEEVKFLGAARIKQALPELKRTLDELLELPLEGRFRRANVETRLEQLLLLAERVTPVTMVAEKIYQALVVIPREMLIYVDVSEKSLSEATRLVAPLALLRAEVFESRLKREVAERFIEEAFALLEHEDYNYLVELADVSMSSIEERVTELRDRLEAILLLEEEA